MPTLEWIGKEKVINHHQEVPFRVLDKKYTFNAEESENMIIHGDNLLALKSLLPQYEGRVDCIYIDPPYNTGNEKWVYNDNVNDPRIKKWLGEVVGTEGEDLSRHDKWLCMMYPRLKLLHKLLSEKGAIFISIDYREQYLLRSILNEIFGASNYVAEIACVNNPKGRSDDEYFATAHENIFVYRKTDKFVLGGFVPEKKVTKRYNKIDENGLCYREIDLRKTGDQDLRNDRPNLFYPFFYNEKTKELIVGNLEEEAPTDFIKILPMKSSNIEGRWRWEQETAKEKIEYLICRWMPAKKQWSVFEKDFLQEKTSVTPTTVWDFKDVNSERGTEIFVKYLGFQKSDFPNPKPVGTIERIITIGMSQDSIILDSFAGSGTTAHAVLNMNKQDGGNRKFILVEMMDYADTIMAERAKRVIKGYGESDKAVEGTGGDFTYYELGEPLFKDGKNLNEAIDEDEIRKYIYYMETKEALQENYADNKYLLGANNDTAFYFYYEKDKPTTLNYEFLATLNTKASAYIIYADICALPKEFMEKYGITFKKIPRDITKL